MSATVSSAAAVRAALSAAADPARASFNARLAPTVDPSRFMGVPMPILRSVARQLVSTQSFAAYAAAAPHDSVEENMVHMVAIAAQRDIAQWRHYLEDFVGFVDNWMVSDCVGFAALRRTADTPARRAALVEATDVAQGFMSTTQVYPVRVGVVLGIQVLRAGAQDAWDDSWEQALVNIPAPVATDPMVAKAVGWWVATALHYRPDVARRLLAADLQGGLSLAARRAAVDKIVRSRAYEQQQRQWARQLRQQWRSTT